MNIKYNQLCIRNAEKKDCEQLAVWWNDGTVMAHAGFPNGLGTSAAEIEKQIKDQFAQSRKILVVREKYYNEFRKILSPKQIMKIYQTEKSNANKFRKEFDRRKGQKHGQGKRPVHGRPAPATK